MKAFPLWVIFDRVQRGLPVDPFRSAPRADIPPAPEFSTRPRTFDARVTVMGFRRA